MLKSSFYAGLIRQAFIAVFGVAGLNKIENVE
jgi:hypothetical protein